MMLTLASAPTLKRCQFRAARWLAWVMAMVEPDCEMLACPADKYPPTGNCDLGGVWARAGSSQKPTHKPAATKACQMGLKKK